MERIVHFFTSCGSLSETNSIFQKGLNPRVYTWTARISASIKLGDRESALELFCKMQQEGIEPDRVTYLCILKVCVTKGAARQGRLIHHQIVKSGLEFDTAVGNSLIHMYSKCDCLEDSCKILDKLPNPDEISWGTMIAGYSQHGHALHALECFNRMQDEGTGIKPNGLTLMCVLKACGSIGAIDRGREIHGQLKESGVELDAVSGSILIDMYAKWGTLEEAHNVFRELPCPNVVSWNSMIAGYVQHKHGLLALELFEKMQQEGITPSEVTFSCTLKACGMVRAIVQGNLIHDQIMRSRLEVDIILQNTLIDMYSKCERLEEAQKIFNALPNPDVVSWGALIAGCVQHDQGLLALEFYEKMQQEGSKPNKIIFSCIVRACCDTGAVDQGKLIHNQIIRYGLQSDAMIQTSLIDMYTKCGSLHDAEKVFDELPERDIVSCGAMFAGYTQHGQGHLGLGLLKEIQEYGLHPNKVILLCALKACSNVEDIEQGRMIHGQIIATGLESDIFIGNSLIDVYVKCGSLEEACSVLLKLLNRDVVSWGAMIAGYVQHAHALPAFELFEKMQQENMQPNGIIFYCLLKACSSIGAVDKGMLIHNQMCRTGVELYGAIGNTLVEMYGKCGCPEEARKVFEVMSDRDIVSWSSMIEAYALQGKFRLANQFLKDMQQEGLKPDNVIFTSLLSACSHAGSVEEGCQFFHSMREDHCITPNVEQYNCVVDLLSRAGCLNEAEDFLQTMPTPPNFIGWMSLLNGCRLYSNTEKGRRCFEELMDLDPGDASAYVLMSNIYASAHMWKNVFETQELRKHTSVLKKPGTAWIAINKEIHEFIVGGQKHPQIAKIFSKMKILTKLIKDDEYVPHLESVLEHSLEKDIEISFYREFENWTSPLDSRVNSTIQA